MDHSLITASSVKIFFSLSQVLNTSFCFIKGVLLLKLCAKRIELRPLRSKKAIQPIEVFQRSLKKQYWTN